MQINFDKDKIKKTFSKDYANFKKRYANFFYGVALGSRIALWSGIILSILSFIYNDKGFLIIGLISISAGIALWIWSGTASENIYKLKDKINKLKK